MANDINSIMLLIHPSTAIIGYVLIIISIILITSFLIRPMSTNSNTHNKFSRFITWTKGSLYLTWFFNFFGLITGMLWAQLAWGSYWSWDPKENATLIIFLMVCSSVLLVEYKKNKLALLFLIIAIVVVIINVLITLGNYGLHSYGFT